MIDPAGHEYDKISDATLGCSCGDTHTHMQLECSICGHVHYVHPVEQDKVRADLEAEKVG